MEKGRYGIHGGQYIPETLMNEVIRLEEAYTFYKNDPDFIYFDNFVIYEALNEKTQYEQVVEIIRKGAISEVKKQGRFSSKIGVPFIYW